MHTSARLYINIFTFMIAFSSMDAQVGIRAKYLKNGINDQQIGVIVQCLEGQEDILNSGFAVGIDYWFRLPNQRIEFLPEVGIGGSSTSFTTDAGAKDKYSMNSAFLNLNTRIYPMDFAGDCDCPTFSNQSTLLKKGFYFELSPGLSFNNISYETIGAFSSWLPDGNYEGSSNSLAYKIGLGAGLDIGINNLLTVNPYVLYNYHFGIDIFEVTHVSDFKDVAYGTEMGQLELGVRFALRFDADKY